MPAPRMPHKRPRQAREMLSQINSVLRQRHTARWPAAHFAFHAQQGE